ncbi:MAG: hypothetical protein JHC95_06940 [Solirubrobacteraceae bacterium]|nr:hypothetical protein [Solirubrobacteraceae bacterium]
MQIPARFNGPPGSGNGGYSAGLLAAHVEAPAVEVTLRLPPPLERPLAIEQRDGATVALNGDDVVLEARPVELDLDPPAAPPLDDAVAADEVSLFRDGERHPFPTCVVCGPNREPGDGLRLFSGPLGDHRFATVFRPTEPVTLPLLWAALDCPSSAPAIEFEGARPPSVLARLAVRPLAELEAGQTYPIVSWSLGEDGRKRTTGVAAFTEAGEPVAIGRALWIELRG